MAQWWFARHGESIANAEGWLAGHVDSPLTARGRDQARALSQMLGPVPIARAWCSDLSRAHETARIGLAGRPVPLHVSPRLRERHLGGWERITRTDRSKWTTTLLSWTQRPPGGESQRDVALRVVGLLAEVAPCEDTTLVVVHGGVMRAVIGALDELPLGDRGRVRYDNTDVVRREVANDGWLALHAVLEAGR
jgi:broad specificity phosphatase PhoE